MKSRLFIVRPDGWLKPAKTDSTNWHAGTRPFASVGTDPNAARAVVVSDRFGTPLVHYVTVTLRWALST